MDEEGRVKFIGFVEEAGELSKVRIFPQFCEGIRDLTNIPTSSSSTGFTSETAKGNAKP